tara:strand:- start:2014 stop:2346 length:333 start_codon:yes stop_codon:yes gene_type:complete
VTTIYLVQGDTGPQIKITVTREDTASAIDVSGGSAKLKVRKTGSTSVLFTLTAATTGSDLQNGILLFSLDGGQLATIAAGNYEGEVELTFSDSSVETVFERVDIVIREDF